MLMFVIWEALKLRPCYNAAKSLLKNDVVSLGAYFWHNLSVHYSITSLFT